MAYRLPPLSTLRVFEAAGRLLSFKAAAEELGITPSAVSHSIQTLEVWLGVPVFIRTNRNLTLSPAGAAYLPRVREALEALAEATAAIPGQLGGDPLRISVAPTFALRWLLPRLPDFQRANPDITVAIDTDHRVVAFPRDGFDLAIRMGRGDWTAARAERLVTERLIPVCTPEIAARIRTPDDLRGIPLLHVVSVREDWQSWAEARGVDTLDLHRGLRLDTVYLALDAAAQGLGIAIGHKPLTDGYLTNGRLVEVLGPPVASKSAYWLVSGDQGPLRPEAARFRDWLFAQLAVSRPAS